jgi:branched-chain amino acid transport system substrate-binding protein
MGVIGLGTASTDAWAENGTIHLGIVAPMSGPNSRYGSFSLRGAQLAAEEINDAGGVGGHKMTVIPGDSQGTPVEGVSATRRLIDLDKADFIIGDVSSSVTLAMQPVVEDAGVLLLNAASSNPKITYGAGAGGFKWTFRNYPTDENRALVVIQYAVEKRGFTKFAILSVDTDYGRAAIEFTKKYLPRFKGEILTEDYYKEGEVDFRSVLAKIRDSGAQAIIMYGLADTTPIVARQMIEVGVAGKMPLIGNGEFNTETTIKAAPLRPRHGCQRGTLPRASLSWRSSKPNTAKLPTITPTFIGKRFISWPRPSRQPAAPTVSRFAMPCPRSSMTAPWVR